MLIFETFFWDMMKSLKASYENCPLKLEKLITLEVDFNQQSAIRFF